MQNRNAVALRRMMLATTAAAGLILTGAAAHAQSTAKPSDQPPTIPAAPAADHEQATPKPNWLPQGAQPSANDPIPAPTPETAQNVPPEPPQPPAGTVTAPGSNAPRNWTTDQILTATVHQAWILAGKDEGNFFEIVRELAEISASNRNLTLPDTPDAGHKAGDFIKAQARADHDQLLYDIVDKAVRMTGTRAPEAATSSAPSSQPR